MLTIASSSQPFDDLYFAETSSAAPKEEREPPVRFPGKNACVRTSITRTRERRGTLDSGSRLAEWGADANGLRCRCWLRNEGGPGDASIDRDRQGDDAGKKRQVAVHRSENQKEEDSAN